MKKHFNLLLLSTSFIWIINWIISFVVYEIFNNKLQDNLISIPEFNDNLNILLISPLVLLLITSLIYLYVFLKFKKFLKIEINIISKKLLKMYSYFFVSSILFVLINSALGILTCVIFKNSTNDNAKLVLLIIGLIFSILSSIFNGIYSYILNLRYIYDNQKKQKDYCE